MGALELPAMTPPDLLAVGYLRLVLWMARGVVRECSAAPKAAGRKTDGNQDL